ncbi:MAG: hypothetical protein QF464_04590, partial [Myxococcota bacterium]|nr:hypothetical protein [Myxococcota bacterium]
PVVVEEVLGLCPDQTTECSPNAPCQDAQPCEGYVPVEMEPCEGFVAGIYVGTNPDTGEIFENPSLVICFDGYCHEGNQINEAAQECCWPSLDNAPIPWCEGVGAQQETGCMAWGPPAPPVHDGGTLAQRIERWLG